MTPNFRLFLLIVALALLGATMLTYCGARAVEDARERGIERAEQMDAR